MTTPFLKHKRPDRFFILLILLHTGSRVGEVAKLEVNDVKKEDGVCCFDVHPSDETSVKTKSSIRLAQFPLAHCHRLINASPTSNGYALNYILF